MTTTGGGGAGTADNNIDNSNNNINTLTKIGFSGNGTILAGTDYRFFLLRHTSLWQAMLWSDYCSTRLQLSTARGLQKLLAQTGLPLTECHQPFVFMKPALRRKLTPKLREHAADVCLPQFKFTSFVCVTVYQSLLSASDTFYALLALLECE